MRAFLIALFFAVSSHAQPLFLQPERAVTPIRIGPFMGGLPRTATNGTTTLLVWDDARVSNAQPVVCAARVDANGTLLDSPSSVLPLTRGAQPFWNGSEFVVVASNGYMRLLASGEWLDATPQPMPVSGLVARVTWSGTRLLVTGSDDAGIYGVLFDGAMNVVRPRFPLDYNWTNGRTASNGDGFMTVYWESIAAIDLTGKLTVAAHRAVNYVAAPDSLIASDGTNYLLIFYQYATVRSDFTYQAMSVTPGGVVRTFGGTFALPYYGAGELVWDGDSYRLLFGGHARPGSWDEVEMRSVTLDREGNNLDGDGTVLMHLGNRAGWVIAAGGNAEVRFAFWVDDSGWKGIGYRDAATFNETASAPFTFSRGALPEETPALATAGDVSLLVWREAETNMRDSFALFAQRVDRSGRFLDAAPRRVATLSCGGMPPAVATDGKDFLVAWEMPASIRAVRIAHDGTLLDELPIVVTAPGTFDCGLDRITAASNGSTWLVAWPYSASVYGTRISNSGAPLDLVPLVLTKGDNAADVHAASNGRDFLVAWTDTKLQQARATRLTAAGSILDAAGLPLLAPFASALYWSGTNYVLLSIGSGGTVPVRITSDGLRLDLVPGGAVTPAIAIGLDPRIDCNARGCFSETAIHGVVNEIRIDDAGTAVTFDAKPIMTVDPSWLELIVFGDTLKTVVYQRVANEPQYASTRHLFIRSTQLRGRPVR